MCDNVIMPLQRIMGNGIISQDHRPSLTCSIHHICITICRKLKSISLEVASNGITSKPNFTKICSNILKLLHGWFMTSGVYYWSHFQLEVPYKHGSDRQRLWLHHYISNCPKQRNVKGTIALLDTAHHQGVTSGNVHYDVRDLDLK